MTFVKVAAHVRRCQSMLFILFHRRVSATASILGLLMSCSLATFAVSSNDNFINRIPISLGQIGINGDSTGATKEAGEPVVASGAHSLWWTWTSTYSGLVSVSTKGSSFDTALGIFTGTTVSTLTMITSNDDYTYGDYHLTGYTSLTVFQATAGTTYQIMVDGFNGAQGNVSLALQMTPTATVAATTSAMLPSTNGTFTVSFNSPVVDQVPVAYGAPSGTALLGTEYSFPNSPVIMPPSTTSAQLTVSVINVAAILGNKTVILSLSPSTFIAPLNGYIVGATSSSSLTIVDNKQPVVFVDPTATGANDGTTWGNAFTGLQAALSNSANGNQMWVRQGTYKPTATTDRTISFQIKSGVEMYGGFAGTEAALGQRDWKNSPTILSGDIGTIGTFTDDSMTVVKANGVSGFVFDGFIVRDGYGATQGGGMWFNSATGAVRNCVFTNNRASYGAGVFNQFGNLTVNNCSFVNNTATNGGFLGHGGGVYNFNGLGGVYTNCVFANNQVLGSSYGGAGVFNESLSVGGTRFVNCSFSGNSALTTSGGGAYEFGSGNPGFINCIFWGNAASVAGTEQIANLSGGTANAMNCDFQGGLPSGTVDNGGNLSNQNPQFFNAANPAGADGIYGTADDGLFIGPESPCVNLGTASGAPITDMVGNPRPMGGGYDIGAYEVPIIFVDPLAVGGAGNGKSWNNAFITLQAAITPVSGPQQIWVKAGTYKPTNTTDRAITFQIKSGMALFGGFAGNEKSLAARDWRAWPTVLSGDIGAIGIMTDNSYNVVVDSSGGTIDGFIVRDGYNSDVSGYGSGLKCASATTVRNCLFTANSSYIGGAMSIQGPATVSSTSFIGNASPYIGGAVWAFSPGVSFTNCVFSQNSVTGATYGGGAVFVDLSTNPAFTNCTFNGNSSLSGKGGGIYNYNNSSPTILNCIFWGDSAPVGPEIYDNTLNSPSIAYTDFQGSFPSGTVAGAGNISLDPNFIDSVNPIGRDNIPATADDGLALNPNSPCVGSGTSIGAPSSDFIGYLRNGVVGMGAYARAPIIYVKPGAAGSGASWASATSLMNALAIATPYANELWLAGGTYNPTSGTDRNATFQLKSGVPLYGGFAGNETSIAQRDWTISRSRLSGDIGSLNVTSDNSYHVVTSAPHCLLSGIIIEEGNADSSGPGLTYCGGGILDVDASTVILDCVFKGNLASTYGGAIFSWNSSATTATVIRNSLFFSNTAAYGGAVLALNAAENFANCTFANNSATTTGGALYNYSGIFTLYDNILWGDTSPEIYNAGATVTVIAYNDIKGSGGSGANWTTSMGLDAGGNIDTNPLFVNSSNITGADNKILTDDDGLRLTPASPCVNTGFPVGSPRTDLLNHPRPIGPAPDMGCFEGKVPLVAFATITSNDHESNPIFTIPVVLSAASDLPVKVSFFVTPGGTAIYGTDYVFDPSANPTTTLTFPPGTISQNIVLNVTRDFVQTPDKMLTINLQAPRNANLGSPAGHVHTIINDDVASIVVSPTTGLQTSEGGTSAIFGVTLTSKPSGANTVSVTFKSTAPTIGLLSLDGGVTQTVQVTVIFDGAHPWNVTQTVTVAGQSDLIDDGDITYSITTAAAVSGDPYFSGFKPPDVTVLNHNIDQAGLAIRRLRTSDSTYVPITTVRTAKASAPAITTYVTSDPTTVITPGHTDSFRIFLTSKPTSSVFMPMTVSNGHAVVSPTSVTLDSTNWNTGISVTVTGVTDDISDAPLTTVPYVITVNAATSSDGKYSGKTATINGGNDDKNVAGVNVSLTSGTNHTTEAGGTATYAVVLTSQPTAGNNVTIVLDTDNHNAGLASPTTLTFSPIKDAVGGWNVPQALTVTGQRDFIAANPQNYNLIQASPTATSVTSGDPNYNGIIIPSLPTPLTNDEGDSPGIVFTPTTGLTTTGAGGTASFTVVLTSIPSAPVSFSLASSNTAEGVTGVTGATFAAAAATSTGSITFSGQPAVGQTVTITDGVTPVTFEFDNGTVIVAGRVGVTIGASATATRDALQTAISASSLGTPLTSTSLTATSSGLLVINLSTASARSLTAPILVSGANVTASGMGGGANQWKVPVTITVTGKDDLTTSDVIYYVTRTAVSSTDPNYSLAAFPNDLSAVQLLNESINKPGVTVTPEVLATTEAIGPQHTATFTVVLNFAPTATVTMNVSSSNPAVDTVSPGTLTFGTNPTGANGWAVPQTVTVTGVNTFIADGNKSCNINFSLTGAAEYAGLVVPPVVVNTLNNNLKGITVSPTNGLTTTEAGGIAAFTVVLKSRPTAGIVDLPLSVNQVNGLYEGLISSPSSVPSTPAPVPSLNLKFTGANWNIPQQVIITGQNYPIADGNLTYLVSFGGISDPGGDYNLFPSPGPVTVVNQDSHVAGVQLSKTTVNIAEATLTIPDTYTVALQSQPLANVIVTINPGAQAAVDTDLVAVGLQNTLTFTALNWSTPQAVNVYAINENVAEGPHSSTITHSATSTDLTYNAIGIANVTAFITDKDIAGITVGAISGHTKEDGTAATFTLHLNTQPRHKVTALITSSNTNIGTVSPALLTFTPANYASDQIVTVIGVHDFVQTGPLPYQIRLATVSADAAYDGLSIPPIAVINDDIDTAGIQITVATAPPLVTSEAGTSVTFTVALTAKPSGNNQVTIPLSSSLITEGVVSPAQLAFTPSNWNSAQVVTVTGVPDNIDDGDQPYTAVLARGISSDANYGSPTLPYTTLVTATSTSTTSVGSASVSMLNTNIDYAGITINPISGLLTTEGGATANYSMVLNSKPLANVTVNIAPLVTTIINSPTVVTAPLLNVSSSSVTFTSGNWNLPQSVVVSAIADSIVEGTPGTPHTSAIANGVQGGVGTDPKYAALTLPNVTVLIVDSDTAGFIVTPTSGLVTTEASGPQHTATFTVKLTSKPTDPVSFGLNSSNTLKGVISTTGLTFAAQALVSTGTISLTGVPTDGNTVTISDGVIPRTFEFDNNSMVSVGNIAVPIGVDAVATRNALLSAITSSTLVAPVTTMSLTVSASGPSAIALATSTARSLTAPILTIGAMVTATGMSGGANLWNVPATVTVTGVDNFIADGDIPYSINLGNAVSLDPHYNNLKPSDVLLVTKDDDIAGVAIIESTHGINFPGTNTDLSEFFPTTAYTYTVALTSQPIGPVIITINPIPTVITTIFNAITINVDTDLVTPGFQNTLSFNAGNWKVPQTVYITSTNNNAAEGTPYSATVTHLPSGGGYTGVSAPSVTVSVTDKDLSSPPVITFPGVNPVNYVKHSSGRSLDATATVTDPDSPDFDIGVLTATFTSGSTASEDILAIQNQGSGIGQIGIIGTGVSYQGVHIGNFTGGMAGVPLVVNLSGAVPSDVSIPSVQALVRNIQYSNSSSNPSLAIRTVTITLNDGDGATSAPVTKNITVTPVDDPPIANPATFVTFSNITLTGALTGSDPELSPVTYAIVTPPLKGILTVNSLTGAFTYVPQPDDHGSYTFVFRVTETSANPPGPLLSSPPATVKLQITGGDDMRPQVVVAPAHESQLGVQQATIVIDPTSKSGLSPLAYSIIGLPPGVTASVAPLTNTATSQTALLTWQITAGSPQLKDHFSFGILVVDVDAPAANYQSVTIQLVSPLGPG